jgi:hypothetical protein
MQPGVACIAFRRLARFSSGRRGSLAYLEEQRSGAFSIFDPSTSVLEFSKFSLVILSRNFGGILTLLGADAPARPF